MKLYSSDCFGEKSNKDFCASQEITIGSYETFTIVQDQCIHEFTGPAKIQTSQNILVNASLDYLLNTASDMGYCIDVGSGIYAVIQRLRNDLLVK